MIDDLEETMELVEKMKGHLSISAYPTRSFCNSMKYDNNIKLTPKGLLEITDVLYMGDVGGIGCTVSLNAAEKLLVISLTHLKIKELHPLVKEIRAYQVNRKRALAKK